MMGENADSAAASTMDVFVFILGEPCGGNESEFFCRTVCARMMEPIKTGGYPTSRRRLTARTIKPPPSIKTADGSGMIDTNITGCRFGSLAGEP